jgi:dTDP-4-dehydrorhamnose 3,5-epimerase
MNFIRTAIPGCMLIQFQPVSDERGWFERLYCAESFRNAGLTSPFVQCSMSYNARRGTLRGMHMQVTPHQESKLVHVLRGSAYDVVLDLRPNSASYGQYFSQTLSSLTHTAIYVPPGCAHGFQTLEDDTVLMYHISPAYSPQHARTVRWDDPAYAIHWPIADPILSDRDRHAPLADAGTRMSTTSI